VFWVFGDCGNLILQTHCLEMPRYAQSPSRRLVLEFDSVATFAGLLKRVRVELTIDPVRQPASLAQTELEERVVPLTLKN